LILRATEDTKEVIFLDDLVKEIPDGLKGKKVTGGEWLSRGCARSEAIKRAARTLAKKGLIGYGRRCKPIAPFTGRYRAAVWWIPEINVVRRRTTLREGPEGP